MCEWGLWGIDHMLPHYVNIHPTYEKSMDICVLHFNKNFKICLNVDAVDALMVKGLRKGVAWGTWPRDGAQEDAERRKWEAQGLIRESRGPQAPLSQRN